MAKLKIFSAQDSKFGVFMTPFMLLHVGQALRAWDEVCMDGKSPMSKFPQDFCLYEVGEFDEESGLVTALSPIKRLASAAEVLAAHGNQDNFGLKSVK